MTDKYLTARELATRLNVHIETVRRWEKAGHLTPIRVGPNGQKRYAPDTIQKLQK